MLPISKPEFKASAVHVRAHIILFLLLLLLAWRAPLAGAAPGEFDQVFGQNGIATVSTIGRGKSLFVTTDGLGGVLATGYTVSTSGAIEGSVRLELIARMLANGNPDTRLNVAGSIISPATRGGDGGGYYFGHQGMSLLSAEGGWLAIRAEDWYCPLPAACSHTYLPKVIGRRVNADGNNDPSYGPVFLGGGYYDGTQLLPDPDGGVTMISAGPDGFQGLDHNTRVQRITANMQPDANFNAAMSGNLGCRMLPEADGRRSTAKALRLADGKLLLAQGIEINPNAAFRIRVPTPNPHRVCVSRFNADGTVDASYGSNGDLLLDASTFTSWQNTPIALFPMPSGGAVLVLDRKMVLSGSIGSYYSIVWLTAEGSLDTSRGLGHGVIGPTNVVVAVVTAAAIQQDGTIILAGYPESRPQYDTSSQEVDYSQPVVGKLRYDSNSPSFGVEGKGTTPLVSFGRRLIPNHLHIAGDGSIFIAGALASGAYEPYEFTQFAVGKLQGDPLPVSPAASQGGGGGGCGITRDPRIDPTLPGLVLLAFLAYGTRRWRGR